VSRRPENLGALWMWVIGPLQVRRSLLNTAVGAFVLVADARFAIHMQL
jgi:hypothetical protein